MKRLILFLGNLDRRVIYVVLVFAVGLPLLWPIGMPITVTKEVKNIYDFIEAQPPGTNLMLSVSYDPTVKAELDPMYWSVLRHAFRKKQHLVVVMTNVQGLGLAEDGLRKIALESGAKYGEDYVLLPYQPISPALLILAMGKSFATTFRSDQYGTAIDSLPFFKTCNKLEDVALCMDFSGGVSPGTWIAYARERFKRPIAAGVTAVMAADFYPYLQSGQLIGMMGGLKAAAEYEDLIQKKENATKGMDAQSAAHLIIIGFIILGNLPYFYRKSLQAGKGV